MKNKALVFITIVLSLSLMAAVSTKQSTSTSHELEIRYKYRLQKFKSELETFKSVVSITPNNKEIRNQYRAVRIAFKQWEYLAEWENGMLLKELINGAPLPKLEKNSFASNIIEPHGLQVMDELIGEWHDNPQRSELLKEISHLLQVTNQISESTKIYDYEFFAASRVELIRLFSLGLSGFDAPGTLSSIDDAKEVWKTLDEDFELYSSNLMLINKDLASKINTVLKNGTLYFKKNNDFNRFDRFEFLTEYLNPLYKYIDIARSELNIETLSETQNVITAWNENSQNLFSDDFFNIDFFSKLPNQFTTTECENLGRMLFFDPLLSKSEKMSCASCHKPELAFTDGYPKSMASIDAKTVKRNSMTLYNCVTSERFFWDLRTENLQNQLEHVISDSLEFATSTAEVLRKISSSEKYPQLFKKAFNTYEGEVINPQTLSFALTAYVSSLKSYNSHFDKLVRKEIPNTNKNVIAGFNLFMGKAACGTCHFAPSFSGLVPPDYKESESEVLGIPKIWPATTADLDEDRGRINSKMKEIAPFYDHSFKTVTVRNVKYSAPYMHNGSMADLKSVMDFYNKGGGQGVGLSVAHQTLSAEPLNLSKSEISDMISFMEALSDIEKR